MRHKAEDPGEKGGIPCVIRTGAVLRRRDVPAVRPDNMSGTDVARYLHAGDEAAHCYIKVASGSSLLGRIRTVRMRRVPKAQNLSLSSGG